MTSRPSIMIPSLVFSAGLCAGWFGKSWFGPVELQFSGTPAEPVSSGKNPEEANYQDENTEAINTVAVDSVAVDSVAVNATADQVNPGPVTGQSSYSPSAEPSTQDYDTTNSVQERFNRLLKNQRYQEAIMLYQEQKLQNEQIAGGLKQELFVELDRLTKVGDNSAFSALIDSYLSVYYDDIDALLILADFNHVNSNYLEAIDVYLLAKTYAYSNADLEKVVTQLNNFVEKIDSSYTSQKNWWPLLNFYAHINTSGLMTSRQQYRQAIAHLRSGDENFAIEQFNELLSDSLVGDSAAKSLASLTSGTTEPPVIINTSIWEGAESVPLEKFGNQYAAKLHNNEQNHVNLLIDTGASMTAISSASFNTLNANNAAVQRENRVFRTAGGVIQGTVYAFPKLTLGSFVLENTKVAVIDFGTERNFDGLLGMNILGQFRFQIDQEKNRLLLLKE